MISYDITFWLRWCVANVVTSGEAQNFWLMVSHLLSMDSQGVVSGRALNAKVVWSPGIAKPASSCLFYSSSAVMDSFWLNPAHLPAVGSASRTSSIFFHPVLALLNRQMRLEHDGASTKRLGSAFETRGGFQRIHADQ